MMKLVREFLALLIAFIWLAWAFLIFLLLTSWLWTPIAMVIIFAIYLLQR